jgi:hypothetical protein
MNVFINLYKVVLLEDMAAVLGVIVAGSKF